ncbi:ATP synthase CF0 subunit I [Tanacetum coccineum]
MPLDYELECDSMNVTKRPHTEPLNMPLEDDAHNTIEYTSNDEYGHGSSSNETAAIGRKTIVIRENTKINGNNVTRQTQELREGAVEQLEKARTRLRKVEIEADQFRVNGYSEIEREKLNLIDSTYKTLEQLENYKNETINFEQQKASNQVRQRVFQQALQGALGTLNSCLNSELHLRTISANIGILGAMKQITD